MSAETNRPKVAVEEIDSSASEVLEQQEIERIAGKAAKRAEETEKLYDEEHDIFTK